MCNFVNMHVSRREATEKLQVHTVQREFELQNSFFFFPSINKTRYIERIKFREVNNFGGCAWQQPKAMNKVEFAFKKWNPRHVAIGFTKSIQQSKALNKVKLNPRHVAIGFTQSIPSMEDLRGKPNQRSCLYLSLYWRYSAFLLSQNRSPHINLNCQNSN